MHVIVKNIISGEVCKFRDHSSNNIRDIGPIAAGQKCKNYPSRAYNDNRSTPPTNRKQRVKCRIFSSRQLVQLHT